MGESPSGYAELQFDIQVSNKHALFTMDAVRDGPWSLKSNVRYPFVLHESRRDENLHECLRRDAIEYFASRGIPWHGGDNANTLPTGHLGSSQVACINSLFPLRGRPAAALAVVRAMGFDAASVLKFPLPDGESEDAGGAACLAFEWNEGPANYLGEHHRGARSRGKYATSADFAVAFLTSGGRRHLVLGEWKYTESYDDTSKRYSKRGTDRSKIYASALSAPWNPTLWQHLGLQPWDMMYDPFDQLMRLQLLAAAIEHHCPEVDEASVVWVVPDGNRSLLESINGPAMRDLASRHGVAGVTGLWTLLVGGEKFRRVSAESVLRTARTALRDEETDWAAWMEARYGKMGVASS